jgi:hypothetical protein
LLRIVMVALFFYFGIYKLSHAEQSRDSRGAS